MVPPTKNPIADDPPFAAGLDLRVKPGGDEV